MSRTNSEDHVSPKHPTQAPRHQANKRATPFGLCTHRGPIDGRIGVHDSNQFEVKLDYRIDPVKEVSRYRVETYFFVPKNLGLSRYTYGREQFYSDIQAYIRFKTPLISLCSLIDGSHSSSPLTRLHRLLAEHPKKARQQERISYELRLLGCLARANLRNRVVALVQRLQRKSLHAHSRSALVREVAQEVRALVEEAEGVLSAVRALQRQFAADKLASGLCEIYQHVNEYLSLTFESHLTMLLDQLSEAPEADDALAYSRHIVTTALIDEQQTRRSWERVCETPHANETYLYRRGLLKKFVMSVLFLEISKEKENRHAHVVAAVAAGIAMLFAATAALITQKWYALNSLPFIMALVGSYVLKDRIKELVKQYGASKLTHWLWDYNVSITCPVSGMKLGRCREAFRYMDFHEVPAEILQRRYQNTSSSLELHQRRDVIIRYEKDICLRGRDISTMHQGRLLEVNDIMRFNIGHFLSRTDDPLRTLRWFDAQRHSVLSVDCPKVYHLNLVFVLRAQEPGVPPQIEQVRVVLDKRGIRRLDTA